MCVPECHEKVSCAVCFAEIYDDDDDYDNDIVDGKKMDADEACCCSTSDKQLCCAMGKLKIYTFGCKCFSKFLKCLTCCCSCACINNLVAYGLVLLGIFLVLLGGIIPFMCLWQNVKLHLAPQFGLVNFTPGIITVACGIFILVIPLNHYSFDPLNKIVNEKARLRFAIGAVGMIVVIFMTAAYTITAYSSIYQKPQNPWDSFNRWISRIRNPSSSPVDPDQDFISPGGILISSILLAFGFLFVWAGRVWKVSGSQQKFNPPIELKPLEDL